MDEIFNFNLKSLKIQIDQTNFHGNDASASPKNSKSTKNTQRK